MQGQRAVVFPVTDGSRRMVVRCYVTPPEQTARRRYVALAEFMSAAAVPFLPRTVWHDEGIEVNGERYPALIMEFAHGMPLGRFVQQHCLDQALLSELAESWRRVVQVMADEGFAHGDLQANNIVVSDSGSLALVDFDAIWLAQTALEPPVEVGHEDFQHPARLAGVGWGRHMDTFPACSIYASLVMLAEDPELQVFLDDDRLLFERRDYGDLVSELWLTAHTSASSRIRDIAAALANLCNSATPPECTLEEVMKGKVPIAPASLSGTGRWYSLSREHTADADTGIEGATLAPLDGTWWSETPRVDEMPAQPQPQQSVSPDTPYARRVVVVGGAVVAFLIVFAIAIALLAGMLR